MFCTFNTYSRKLFDDLLNGMCNLRDLGRLYVEGRQDPNALSVSSEKRVVFLESMHSKLWASYSLVKLYCVEQGSSSNVLNDHLLLQGFELLLEKSSHYLRVLD